MKSPAEPEIDSRYPAGIPRSLIFRTPRGVSRDGKISWRYRLRLENGKTSSPVDFHHAFRHRYEDTEAHKICVKVIDTFGSDTSILIQIPGTRGGRISFLKSFVFKTNLRSLTCPRARIFLSSVTSVQLLAKTDAAVQESLFLWEEWRAHAERL